MATVVKRPAIVSILGTLGLISGILKTFVGLVFAFSSGPINVNGSMVEHTVIMWTGIVIALFGAFTVFIASSVLSGAKWAQVWYGVVAALGVVDGLWSIVANHSVSVWAGLVAVVLNFIILQLLFSDRAQAYFESK